MRSFLVSQAARLATLLTTEFQVVTVSRVSRWLEELTRLGVVRVHLGQECAAFVLSLLELGAHSWGAIPTLCQSTSNSAIVKAGNAHIGGSDVGVLRAGLIPTSWRGGRAGKSQERNQEGTHRHSV